MIAPRTLTTIGLSIRDELRVKSLLQIVEGKTAAPWVYVEEAQADLALCEPESALARVIIEQSARNGTRRCVMLLRQGAECPPGITCVFSPLGVREFIALLDGVTDAHPAAENASLEPPRAVATASNAPLLERLRQITTHADGRSHHIILGATSLWVLPNQTVVLSNTALTPDHVATLANRRDFEVEAFAQLDPNVADTHVHRCPLPVLLWNCAMAVDTAGASPLPPNATYSLKRWPDFGRFAHSPWHLRLTASMVGETFSAQQMSALVEQPVSKIETFLQACDAIGLLVTNLASESLSSTSIVPHATARAEKPGRWLSIFQTFRQALNMGGGRG